MKTKFIKTVFVVAIAMVSGINVFNAQKSEPLSDVALANVEALAKEETGAPNTGPGEMIECGGAYKGTTKKECMCRNEYSCTSSACS